MTKGSKVINQALKYLGVSEVWGPNRGPQIDKWEARWNLKGEPWCGMFSDAMYFESEVDDNDLNHPSTAEICRRANQKSAFWNGKGRIPVGSLWVNCGVHVALVTADLGDGTVKTIEGNHNNAVQMGRRRISDGKIVVPPAVDVDDTPSPKYEYWLEDEGAKQSLFKVNGVVGVWATKAARDKRLKEIIKSPNWKKYHPRAIARKDWKGRQRYYILLGPLRYYGPFDSKESRDNARVILEEKLGRKLRPFSRKVK